MKVLDKVSSLLSAAFALEPLALKPGNVHPYISIRNNMTYEDFVLTSTIIQPYISKSVKRGFYRWRTRAVFADLLRKALSAVIDTTGTNTCLGSLLLVMPIAYSAGRMLRLRKDLGEHYTILRIARETVMSSTVYDAIEFYKAVRLASPGYIRKTDDVGEQVNVWDPKYKSKLLLRGEGLGYILEKSCSRDIVACEAVSYGITSKSVEYFKQRLSVHRDFRRAISETYLYILSNNIDTMVLRSRGPDVALKASKMASRTLEKIVRINSNNWVKEVSRLDQIFACEKIWPGSTADIIVAVLATLLINNYNKPYTIYK